LPRSPGAPASEVPSPLAQAERARGAATSGAEAGRSASLRAGAPGRRSRQRRRAPKRAHEQIEQEIEAFWEQFTTGIESLGVEVLATDGVTLADIEPYQRFDADWVSFADDSPITPVSADMRA
jgi:hypothetical protein